MCLCAASEALEIFPSFLPSTGGVRSFPLPPPLWSSSCASATRDAALMDRTSALGGVAKGTEEKGEGKISASSTKIEYFSPAKETCRRGGLILYPWLSSDFCVGAGVSWRKMTHFNQFEICSTSRKATPEVRKLSMYVLPTDADVEGGTSQKSLLCHFYPTFLSFSPGSEEMFLPSSSLPLTEHAHPSSRTRKEEGGERRGGVWLNG